MATTTGCSCTDGEYPLNASCFIGGGKSCDQKSGLLTPLTAELGEMAHGALLARVGANRVGGASSLAGGGIAIERM